MFNSGFANNCGIELFTIGWVTCEQALDTFGGKQFHSNYLVFKPVLKQIENKLPVSAPVVEKLQKTDINLDNYVFESGEESYGLQLDQPTEILLNELPGIEDVIDKAVFKVSVPREKVREKLIELVDEGLKKSRDIKVALFHDDEEIIEILLLADEL